MAPGGPWELAFFFWRWDLFFARQREKKIFGVFLVFLLFFGGVFVLFFVFLCFFLFFARSANFFLAFFSAVAFFSAGP